MSAVFPAVWSDLEFRCSVGGCGTSFSTEDATLHQIRVDLHLAMHELADIAQKLTDMGAGEALRWAREMARATVAESVHAADLAVVYLATGE